VDWRFDGRGKWTAESELKSAQHSTLTYVIDVTEDGEFTYWGADDMLLHGKRVTVAKLREAKRACEAREAGLHRKKRN
jgi:hypothetical protein